MIEIAAEVLKYTGPLILAIFKRALEGKSQKEIAQAVNRDEAWVSRRVQEAVKYDLIEVRDEERWGRHHTYGTYAKWKVNVIRLKEKGREVAKTLLYLDPIIERCLRCGIAIDVTGYSGYISCPSCGHVFHVEGIEPPSIARALPWWAYPLAAFLGLLGGAVVDGENRWRGAACGTGALTAITAITDFCLRNFCARALKGT